MGKKSSLLLTLWTVLVLLGGFGLGMLFITTVNPAIAGQLLSGILSEGELDSAQAEVYVPEIYQHKLDISADTQTQTLYYFPLDSNNHNTILFFQNTGPVTATIDLDYKNDTGGVCGTGVVFDLPPNYSARVSADSLDAGRPASWANTIIYNMFDTCEIGLITMPRAGVAVEGYVVWTATDVYNPRELNPHAEIRFSADPYAIFLSSVNKP